MTLSRPRHTLLALFLSGPLAVGWVTAAPVTLTTPFMNLEHRAVNSLGFRFWRRLLPAHWRQFSHTQRPGGHDGCGHDDKPGHGRHRHPHHQL